ncbi:GntR family transcriptional regulator [Xinfangfangia sp. D13-10-4-6]|uniref:GntR family transcriptional regulator n=1 Tax=Pseudogemmobacter hezensis TaxID=2737662 RepID=UPI0015551BCA|nr:GntR family transcriptional regulator [Pseudogemmobacter hezensis]NPD17642.1 GntR family transcriptional regulator [Pseudogemmobacter hezensis]
MADGGEDFFLATRAPGAKPVLWRGGVWANLSIACNPGSGALTNREKKPTSTERIRVTLADEIVRGQIGPGVVLDETSLAQRFAVSRTPVREAIRQLEAIGFVEARPHRGAVVPLFTPERLNEMFSVMAEMEGLCARAAAEHMPPECVAQLRDAHKACGLCVDADDVAGYYEANAAFHELIYTLGGNGFLADVTRSVRNRLQPFRRAQFSSAGRIQRSIEEHGAIVEAILAGDAEAAGRLARDHIQVVRKSVGRVAPALDT